MLNWYQHLPSQINPIAFAVGSFSVRWYGIMYLIGILTIYGLLCLRIVKGEFPDLKLKNNSLAFNLILDYLLVAFFAALIGGRLGYVIFYNPAYFLINPLAIVSPFNESGSVIGIYGMSYHGALVGIITGSYFFLKRKKIDFLLWADFIIPAAAAGYFFGRIGNFLNGELYGRITNSPIGMYFAQDSLQLRHPSQLYEAFLEGFVLSVILWNLRNKKFQKGFLFGVYLFGYGAVRIFVEQFREPDAQLGLFFGHFTMGQLLSVTMIIFGIYLLVWKNKN